MNKKAGKIWKKDTKTIKTKNRVQKPKTCKKHMENTTYNRRNKTRTCKYAQKISEKSVKLAEMTNMYCIFAKDSI